MKALVQRVKKASVTINNELYSEIASGLLVFLGVTKFDTVENGDKLAQKLANLRIFEDENEKMNLSLNDIGGEVLVVSQFTLYGDCRKGRRPSFDSAGNPKWANELYEKTCQYFKDNNIPTQTGRFAADMKVNLLNDGPVTLLLDSKKLF